jgi:hypothetical protein
MCYTVKQKVKQDLWGLVLNDRVPIPVDGNMHMQFRFTEHKEAFLVDQEFIQVVFASVAVKPPPTKILNSSSKRNVI